ncbi:MAG: FAD-binding oxidoreductase [Myxococcaceae bacterium]|nr:FAD-binding oxidoreductase [Myxococcaceae bacterium]MCI0670213.1 FAD-binding oxidoreductase [Myxococcaceae bacterium]
MSEELRTGTHGNGGPALEVDTADVEGLQSRLRGRLVRPGDPDYDSARRVYNAMVDRHPALVAYCVDVADVLAAVEFARNHHVTVAIRGGGHNAAGLGVADNAFVIDVSSMRSVRVEPASRTVRADAGCVWGDVDHATHAFGLAVPSGFISTTGVAGLTLGGGIGHLTRRYGLTVDSLLAADLVLADGRFVTADADSHPELFWALRGGGGNFGVVTSFLFRAHPVHTVVAGHTLWPLEKSEDVLRWYQDFLARTPEELNGFFAFLKVPPEPPFPPALHRKTMCGVVWCYTGPLERADAAFAPVLRFGPPAFVGLRTMPFPAIQRAFDALYPPGLQWYWKADFFRTLDDEAVALHAQHGARLPTSHSTMHLYPVDGAVQRVGRHDTAFSFRDARFAEVIVGVDPDPANVPRLVTWARDYWSALHPHSAGGAYVNFMMDEGQERVQATYQDNYARLAAVKARYDPDNFFHVNQNIRPSA